MSAVLDAVARGERFAGTGYFLVDAADGRIFPFMKEMAINGLALRDKEVACPQGSAVCWGMKGWLKRSRRLMAAVPGRSDSMVMPEFREQVGAGNFEFA